MTTSILRHIQHTRSHTRICRGGNQAVLHLLYHSWKKQKERNHLMD